LQEANNQKIKDLEQLLASAKEEHIKILNNLKIKNYEKTSEDIMKEIDEILKNKNNFINEKV
jgi:glycerophosphoryl diester phosphodiesterase